MRKLVLLSLVSLAAYLAYAACAAAPGAPRPDDTLARIHALVGAATCRDDGQCRSLALGARPCGGPESYLAFSTAHTPEATVRALGDIYRAERRNANGAAARVSDCRFLPDPGAVCRAGTCQPGAAQPVAR